MTFDSKTTHARIRALLIDDGIDPAAAEQAASDAVNAATAAHDFRVFTRDLFARTDRNETQP